MFIPTQTYKGPKIIVHSIKELVKVLIMHKVSDVLTEKLFRKLLHKFRKDNPSLIILFEINGNSTQIQKVLTLLSPGYFRPV